MVRHGNNKYYEVSELREQYQCGYLPALCVRNSKAKATKDILYVYVDDNRYRIEITPYRDLLQANVYRNSSRVKYNTYVCATIQGCISHVFDRMFEIQLWQK